PGLDRCGPRLTGDGVATSAVGGVGSARHARRDPFNLAERSRPGNRYREGLDAMKAARYPLAVARFTKLQHAYPKSALSEPAEYFAANALFETGSYDQAILQFNDLVMRFPKGKYASAALLREAQAFVKLNDRIDARLTLQKLVADHAGTPEADSANTMMKDLASD